jgi:hypothetical protein
MKRRSKIILWAVGATLLVCIATAITILEIIDRPFRLQMKAGRQFMDSLTPEDIRFWTARAEQLLAQHNPNAGDIGNLPVPADLRKAKVMRVDVSPPDYVSFDWMGGIDHTELVFRKISDGTFEVTAVYSDYEQERLWPTNTANNQMQATGVPPVPDL